MDNPLKKLKDIVVKDDVLLLCLSGSLRKDSRNKTHTHTYIHIDLKTDSNENSKMSHFSKTDD